MTNTAKKRKWMRWTLIAVLVAMAVPVVLVLALFAVISSGVADRYIREQIVTQIAKRLNGTAELGSFHFDPWTLHVALADFTIHGQEPAGTAPFFHADNISVGLRIDSFWGRKFSVGDVEILRPAVHIRKEIDGSSNIPALRTKTTSNTPLRERLFQVVVRRLQVVDGELLYNDVRIPLVVEGQRLELGVDYSAPAGRKMYSGDFRWQQMQIAARHFLPFPSDIAVRFVLEQDALSITQMVWTGPHTSIDAQLSISNFARPALAFRYRGRLGLDDIRIILRKPTTPGGRVDFMGGGTYANSKLVLTGGYNATDIAMRFQWFHARDLSARGSYHADQVGLEVPDLSIHGLGGGITGRLQLQFKGLKFRVDAHALVELQEVLAAVNNPSLPVSPLHWGGQVDVQSVTQWNADFKNLDAAGVTMWTPGTAASAHLIPVTAHFNYHYTMLDRSVLLRGGQISTPSSTVLVEGTLGDRHSDLNATFDSQDLLPWDDFINVLRGPDAMPQVISGRAHWQGTVTGPIAMPTFAGHVKGSQARYGRLYWDTVDGEMSYSPSGFSMTRATMTRGTSSVQFDLSLELLEWAFYPENFWNADATLVRADTDSLQAFLGSSYPVHGLLSGTFHGSGTHAEPELSGLFDIIAPEAWGWRFDRARGQINLRPGEVRVSTAELRLLPASTPPAGQPATPPGLLTGNFLYRTADQQVSFDLTGAVLPLGAIARIQTPRMPIAGQFSFHLTGDGPLLKPKLQGSMRLVDLRLGSEVVGSFNANVNSDGSQLALQVDSAMSAGSLHGNLGVMLSGAYPVTSRIEVAQLDLDPLISGALHLNALTGHSHIDGEFNVSGSLLSPETLSVQANLSRISLDYQYVKLENEGPVRFEYRNSEVRVDQATLRGVDTDFRIYGVARFSGDRAVNLHIVGNVNLRLIGAFVPNLDARGPAVIDAIFAGTISTPSITGRVQVKDASVRYGDFPAGLSNVQGDFIFDTSRLIFDKVTAEIGGGTMQLSGSLTYGGGPSRFDITSRTTQVRVRYPVGMSWLAGATLRLTGTAQGGTLSGAVSVDRLLMSQGVDFGSFLGSSETEVTNAPTSTSAFLRNLQLDIQATSAPNAQLQWGAGSSQADAMVSVRGTWERPILLGSIHLLNGEMTFRGNRYRLTRGDLNFVNPFRLDPVIDIEATTTIRQYEVTVDFSGPASHLTMSYRSDPPLPSSDVINLLALGQTGQESQLRAAGASSTQMGATTLLSEAVSSQLGGRIQRLFGISHFSVDPSYLAETSVSQSPGARITIEQQFSRDFIITYSTDVTSTQEQIIQIEYTLRRDISVIALRDENGTFGIDVVRKARFK